MAEPTFPLFPTDCRSGTVTATFANGGTKSSVIDTSLWRVGTVYLPAEFNTDAITFEGAESETGTFAVLLTSGAASVGFTAANGARWYDIPTAAINCPFIKIVTGTATAAAATIILNFKT